LSDDERLVLLDEVAAGLHNAHQLKLVHRDVTPKNLRVRLFQDDGFTREAFT